MERPSLRPVPARPPRGADPAEALRHVSATLPDLDQSAAGALALVELVGRSRAAAAAELGIERGQLAELLARSRKQLRRTLFPLGASGWCERAERLISDRIDGELRPPGPARLDAHLRNCDRCVEHERRLDQARDGLIQAFAAGHPEPAPLAPPERPRAEPERPVPAPEEIAAGTEFTMTAGDSAFFPANIAGEVRNDGQEPAVVLIAIIESLAAAAATPAA